MKRGRGVKGWSEAGEGDELVIFWGAVDEQGSAESERKGSPFRQPAYDVKIVGGAQVLEKLLQVDRPIWWPELYEEFARALLGGNPAASSGQDKNDVSLLVALTDLQPSTIETENQRISGLLQTNFNDPSLHEMAAVLLGTFALRAFTDNFFDVRSPLFQIMERYSSLNPAGYFTLGKYFADRNDADKAVTYYEKGVEQSKDEVLISNMTQWFRNESRRCFRAGLKRWS